MSSFTIYILGLIAFGLWSLFICTDDFKTPSKRRKHLVTVIIGWPVVLFMAAGGVIIALCADLYERLTKTK